MKKLLTTITLSALVGTSASNLKPIIINHGFKSNQINNKDISLENKNDINLFEPVQINNNITAINKVIVTPNGTIWVGTNVAFGSGRLYKASDGIHFKEINFNFSNIYSLISDKIGNILVVSENGIFYKSNGTDVFTPMSGITGSINSLAVDNYNNIYASSNIYVNNDGTVYKSNGTDVFRTCLKSFRK